MFPDLLAYHVKLARIYSNFSFFYKVLLPVCQDMMSRLGGSRVLIEYDKALTFRHLKTRASRDETLEDEEEEEEEEGDDGGV